MKWSKQEEILLISHFRDKTLSICRRVRMAQIPLLRLALENYKEKKLLTLNILGTVTINKKEFYHRTLDAIRSKARRLRLISKKEM